MLSKEHENILKVVESLDKECDLLESGKQIDREFLIRIVDFIRNYADKFHHAKEENILFKEFCKTAEKGGCNPVEQMLYEHDLGRNAVKLIWKGLENDRKKVIKGARDYIELIKEHISKEDTILYPMSDEILSESVKKKMLAKFLEIGKKNKKQEKKYLDFVKSL